MDNPATDPQSQDYNPTPEPITSPVAQPVPTVPTPTGGQPISLLPPEQDTQPPISFIGTKNATATQLTNTGIEQRASRINYALQGKSPGLATIQQNIQSGSETFMRQSAALDQLIKQNSTTFQMIKDIAKSRNSPLSPEEQTNIMQLVSKENSVNPDTVMEKLWGSNYVKELLTAPSPTVKEAVYVAPKQSMAIATHGSDLITHKQLFANIKEEYDKRWENMPGISNTLSNAFLTAAGGSAMPDLNLKSNDGGGNQGKLDSWLWSSLKDLLSAGIYGIYQTHDAVEGSKDYTNSILPGNNLDEVRDFAYLLPPEQANVAVRKAMEEMWDKDPIIAKNFINSLNDRPYIDGWVENAFAVGNIATMIPAGRLARGAKSAIDGARDVLDSKPIAITEEAAKAAEGIWLSKEDVKQLQTNLKVTLKPGTATTPRGMTSLELKKAGEAFPEEGSYPPSRDFYSQPVTSVGASDTNDISHYRIGTERTPVQNGDKFISSEDASKLTAGTRVYEQDGKLATTRRNENGAWTPTGETISPTEVPSEGNHKLSLGTPKDGMGTTYYDNHSVSPPITALERNTVTQGRDITARELDRVREGTPGYRLRPTVDTAKITEVNNNLAIANKNYDEARFALDDISKTGSSEDIASQTKRVEEARLALKDATQARDTATIFNDHPAIVKAQQGLRSYLASGFKSLRSVPTASGEAKEDLQGTLSILGRTEEAAQTGAIRRVQEDLQGTLNTDPAAAMESIPKDLPSAFIPSPVFKNSSALSRELAQRMSEAMLVKSNMLAGALNGPRVQRLTQQEWNTAWKETKTAVKQELTPRLNQAVLDVDQSSLFRADQNRYYVKTSLGRTDGTLFDDYHAANNTALMNYGLHPGDFLIEQKGNGYVIQHLQPFDERNSVLATTVPTNNLTPLHWPVISALNPVKGASESTSELQNAARISATMYPQKVKNVMQKVVESVKLPGVENGKLEQLLYHSMDIFDDGGNIGKWMGQSELETAYATRYGGLPSPKFVEAYYTYKMLMDAHYKMLDDYVGTMYTRWGGKSMTVKLFNADKQFVDSERFIGRETDWNTMKGAGKRDATLLYVDPIAKTTELHWISELSGNEGLGYEIKNNIEDNGYRLVQLRQPLEKPIAGSSGKDTEVYFVVSPGVEARGIQPGESVAYRGGPHVVYQNGHYLGQPLVGKDAKGQLLHIKDNVFRNVETEAKGRNFAIKYDTARQLMNSGDDAALTDYLRNNLPESIDDFKNMFVGDSKLDPHAPIAYKREGQTIFQNNPEMMLGVDKSKYNGVEYDYPKMKAYGQDYSNPDQDLNAAFLADRANQHLLVPKDLGANVPNRFTLEKAKVIDPFTSLNRALGQGIRSRYMEDYKMLAAESYVKEFSQYIANATPEALARNPAHFLYEGAIANGTPQPIKDAMLQNQQNVKRFLGMQSTLDQHLAYLGAATENMLSKTLGEERMAEVANSNFYQNWLIPTIKNPAAYAKAMAFQAQMGWGNIKQFWQQGVGAFNVLGLSPVHGMSAGVPAASWLQHGGKYALDDAAKLDWYANAIAKSSSFSKADAIQALNAYKDSGVSFVGTESTLRANEFSSPKIYVSGKDKFLDAGTTPYKWGEGINRDVAFFTSVREWQVANVGKPLDQYAMGDIMRRYDNLTFNMTKAGDSALQTGLMSIPMQFFTFKQRQAELMFGNRISGREKAQLMAVNALLYGVPIAGSGAIGLWPVYDSIRSGMLNNTDKVDVHAGYWEALSNGLLQFLVSSATGKKTDISPTLGPNGATIMRDLIMDATGGDSHKLLADLITGAAGQTIGKMITASSPFWKWSTDRITNQDSKYTLTPDDWLGLGRTFATGNTAVDWYYAYNTHKYITQSGQTMGDVDNMDTFLMTVFGIKPEQFRDKALMATALQEAKHTQQQATGPIRTEFLRAIEAMQQNDPELAEKHMTNARSLATAADMRENEVAKIHLQAMQQQKDKINQIDENWRFNDPRQSKQHMHDIEQGITR